MYIALENNHRVRPSKQLRRAVCQCCDSPVIAKTGDKKVWHWAHEFLGNCSQKSKGEWHYLWQDFFNEDEVEVTDPKWPHNIADICIKDPRLPDGYLVVELQESNISLNKIHQRNNAYKHILWITNNLNKKPVKRNFTDPSLDNYAIFKHIQPTLIQLDVDNAYELDSHHPRELLIQLYLKHSRNNIESLIKYTGNKIDSADNHIKQANHLLNAINVLYIKPTNNTIQYKRPFEFYKNDCSTALYKKVGFSWSPDNKAWVSHYHKLHKASILTQLEISNLYNSLESLFKQLDYLTLFYQETFLNTNHHPVDAAVINKCKSTKQLNPL
jgi:competence CoiA-like predicted nuclease